jgi:hypothetical protein
MVQSRRMQKEMVHLPLVYVETVVGAAVARWPVAAVRIFITYLSLKVGCIIHPGLLKVLDFLLPDPAEHS